MEKLVMKDEKSTLCSELEQLDEQLMNIWSVMQMAKCQFESDNGSQERRWNFGMNLMSLLGNSVEDARAKLDELTQLALRMRHSA